MDPGSVNTSEDVKTRHLLKEVSIWGVQELGEVFTSLILQGELIKKF